jgi:transcription elongation factor GreB
MNKAFTKESDDEDDEPDEAAAEEQAHAQLAGVKNYITPSGLQRLRDELRFLLTRERRAVTQVVAWAAGNGDRSENADYQYGKRRLRQIDRRIRFLTKRIDAAEVVDPEAPRAGRAATHVFFGATVRYANAAGAERVVRIVGLDEIDLDRNYISWMSPLARALTKSGPGDTVVLRAPGGAEDLEILEVRYEGIPMDPFTEPLGAEAAPTSKPSVGNA